MPFRRRANAEASRAADQSRSADEAVERECLGEFGADLVARGPFDDRVRPGAARQHQPNAGADLELAFGDGHEPALGNVDHLSFDAVGAELPHVYLEGDGQAFGTAAV